MQQFILHSHPDKPMVVRLGNLEKQLMVVQGFIQKLFGSNFDEYCQSVAPTITTVEVEECDKVTTPETEGPSTFLSHPPMEDNTPYAPSKDPIAIHVDVVEEDIDVEFKVSGEDGQEHLDSDSAVPQVLVNPFVEGDGSSAPLQTPSMSSGSASGENADNLLFFDMGGFEEEEDTVPFGADGVEHKYKIPMEEDNSDVSHHSSVTPTPTGSIDGDKNIMNGNDESFTKKRKLTPSPTHTTSQSKTRRRSKKYQDAKKSTSTTAAKLDEKSDSSEDSEYKDKSESDSSDSEEEWRPGKPLRSHPRTTYHHNAQARSSHRRDPFRPPLSQGRKTTTAPNSNRVPRVYSFPDKTFIGTPAANLPALIRPVNIQKITELPLLINGVYFRLVTMGMDKQSHNIMLTRAKCGICAVLGKELVIQETRNSSRYFENHMKKAHPVEYNHYVKHKGNIDQTTQTLRSTIVAHRGPGVNLIAMEMNKLLRKLTNV